MFCSTKAPEEVAHVIMYVSIHRVFPYTVPTIYLIDFHGMIVAAHHCTYLGSTGRLLWGGLVYYSVLLTTNTPNIVCCISLIYSTRSDEISMSWVSHSGWIKTAYTYHHARTKTNIVTCICRGTAKRQTVKLLVYLYMRLGCPVCRYPVGLIHGRVR
ncbi:hypothetical protein B0T26DRAFT_68244 [Lasiosphaeria miniovina]|uniref:Uncharacterized protein n=1 Tax=Lasiosphaeria miniovina TaxID=1954250 RepID=A0AA40BHK8_9PEZI|nr:uncharacterized protein B0T26DRAFT_68244 [Lasiosphaeria miniovina]KAK0734387.1 hypothetical protein B0T26DRAFT_68244 [Lasiosphaeria miniovina]